MVIYSLRSASKPVIKYANPPFKRLDYAFVIKKDSNVNHFVLNSCNDNKQLEIRWDRPNPLVLDDLSAKECVKTCDFYGTYYGRLYD